MPVAVGYGQDSEDMDTSIKLRGHKIKLTVQLTIQFAVKTPGSRLETETSASGDQVLSCRYEPIASIGAVQSHC